MPALSICLRHNHRQAKAALLTIYQPDREKLRKHCTESTEGTRKGKPMMSLQQFREKPVHFFYKYC